MLPTAQVQTATRLDVADRDSVLALVEAATAADAHAPLNEAALLRLRYPRPDVRHFVARADDGPVVGYAQLEEGSRFSSGQLVVHPDQRRRGVGRLLLDHLVGESVGPLQIWALGNTPGAQGLAAEAGLVAERELLLMRRALDGAHAEPKIPAGVTIRTFRPGVDETAWLELNRAAFVDHPEQGAMAEADLAERIGEAWFDAAGFFLAVTGEGAGEELVGFHWTKQHPGRLGEVYVLGVRPDWAGRGLGKALLNTGLRHLAEQGNATIELYVEADQPAAVGLYASSGFTTASHDVMYAQR